MEAGLFFAVTEDGRGNRNGTPAAAGRTGPGRSRNPGTI